MTYLNSRQQKQENPPPAEEHSSPPVSAYSFPHKPALHQLTGRDMSLPHSHPYQHAPVRHRNTRDDPLQKRYITSPPRTDYLVATQSPRTPNPRCHRKVRNSGRPYHGDRAEGVGYAGTRVTFGVMTAVPGLLWRRLSCSRCPRPATGNTSSFPLSTCDTASSIRTPPSNTELPLRGNKRLTQCHDRPISSISTS